MGGQSLARNGLAVTLDQDRIDVDSAAGTYRVAAGVRWHTVLQRLDALGLSPSVMQSNNDFGVAGTFCVNAHGWPAPFGPFGSTVRSLKLMLADGEMVTCSRVENRGLFETTMGGYGLTGIITELELAAVPNMRLEPDVAVLPAEDFGSRFADAVSQGTDVRMAYGRMNVAIEGFLDEAIMVTYREAPDQSDLPDAAPSRLIGWATRHILRGQVGSERMKDFRWGMESGIAPALTGGAVTRNGLLNEPVAVLADGDPRAHRHTARVLHRSVPVRRVRSGLPADHTVLLPEPSERDPALRGGRSPRAFSPMRRNRALPAVMLFSQETTMRAEADMARMTRALIDAALELSGTYYLPYRLHATAEQFTFGYPRIGEFVARKRAVDPGLLFRNALWDRYMAAH